MTGRDDVQQWIKLSDVPEVFTYSVNQSHTFDLRMVALKLRDESVLLYSPILDVSDEALNCLDAIGPVSALVAPNYFHNLGLERYSRRYPKAKVYAASNAIPRLQRVVPNLIVSEIRNLAECLPDQVSFFEPEGLRTGELWIAVRSGSRNTLIVCDAFFNMTHQKSGLFALILRLAGTIPGLRVSRVFRLLALSKSDRYRASVQKFFHSFSPTLLVPSHGDMEYQESGLAARLQNLI